MSNLNLTSHSGTHNTGVTVLTPRQLTFHETSQDTGQPVSSILLVHSMRLRESFPAVFVRRRQQTPSRLGHTKSQRHVRHNISANRKTRDSATRNIAQRMPHAEITSLRANQPKDAQSPLFVFVAFISPRDMCRVFRKWTQPSAAESVVASRFLSVPPTQKRNKESAYVISKCNVIDPRT